MKEKKQTLISFTKGEWKGKDITHRTDRVNIKLNVNLRKPDEKEMKKKSEEIASTIKDAKIKRVLKSGKLILTVPEGTDIIALAKELSKRPDVIYAEPDMITRESVTPNDSRFGDQWALSKISAEGAWDLETGANDVLIGIIDSGISIDAGNLTHPDLDDTARYTLGTDFTADSDDTVPEDGRGHGTHVVGIAAAETDNLSGISGVNWISPVYICRTFDNSGNGSSSDFESAIEEIVDYAVANNLRAVINYSGGGLDNQTKEDACKYVNDNGMILCAATGNDDGDPVISPALHSANFPGVIAVGASDSDDEVASFSNIGPEVSVVAPGVDILSTFPTYDVSGGSEHDFKSWDGTSMATPHVTGLASLVWSRVAKLTNEQVRDVINNTAVKLGAGDFDDSWGHGRINAADAVAKAGWEIVPVQLTLNFIDIPADETQLRAIRIDVRSFHATTIELTIAPAAPFSMHNFAGSVSIGKSSDYDTPREIYLWVKYTGTNAGDTANGTAQVTCPETGEVFNVTITANTIARPTCAVMLVLDKSGSMTSQSGVDSMTREEVLKYSANIFISIIRENNGLGMVTFDHDAQDLLVPVVGPFGSPDDAFDIPRLDASTAMGGYSANIDGLTAIGDGIERGHNAMASVTGYDKKALIVFTDGHETASKYIADVSSLIDGQVFAVGLGTASQLNPAALNNICNDSGGYLLLTDQLDNDDNFKLAKYFLQIQAGVNNEQVVVDPSGFIQPGVTVKIPFFLNEADISVDAIVMLPVEGLVNVSIETPAGAIIEDSNLGTFPMVKKIVRDKITYYRMTLPVNNGSNVTAQNGRWNIVLKIEEKFYKKYLSSLRESTEAYAQAQAHGVKYTALVHAYSNLRMHCTLSQDHYESGTAIHLRAGISEYGIPLGNNASVKALLKMPDGSFTTIVLYKVSTGVYEGHFVANYPGIYAFTVQANGFTSRNVKFTREQVLTAAAWKGGNNPVPTSSSNPDKNPTHEALCKLLHCLDKTVSSAAKKRLIKDGFDIEALMKCFCPPQVKVEKKPVKLSSLKPARALPKKSR